MTIYLQNILVVYKKLFMTIRYQYQCPLYKAIVIIIVVLIEVVSPSGYIYKQ